MAQGRVEASLVGNILNRANLLSGIDVAESSSHNSIAFGDLTVRAIDVSWESSSGVRELVRMVRRGFGSRGEQMGDISHGEGHSKCQLERVTKRDKDC